MFINLKTLLHLPVYTESGTHLGRIKDCELDTETHSVRCYMVEGNFFGNTHYVIMPIQIRAITADKIIVADAVSKLSDTAKESKKKMSQPALGGVAPRAERN